MDIDLYKVDIINVSESHKRSYIPDISRIYEVTRQIGNTLRRKDPKFTVVMRGIVPLGTNIEVRKIIKQESMKSNIYNINIKWIGVKHC